MPLEREDHDEKDDGFDVFDYLLLDDDSDVFDYLLFFVVNILFWVPTICANAQNLIIERYDGTYLLDHDIQNRDTGARRFTLPRCRIPYPTPPLIVSTAPTTRRSRSSICLTIPILIKSTNSRFFQHNIWNNGNLEIHDVRKFPSHQLPSLQPLQGRSSTHMRSTYIYVTAR